MMEFDQKLIVRLCARTPAQEAGQFVDQRLGLVAAVRQVHGGFVEPQKYLHPGVLIQLLCNRDGLLLVHIDGRFRRNDIHIV